MNVPKNLNLVQLSYYLSCLRSIILSYINMMRHEYKLSYPLYLYYSNIKDLYAVIMDVTQNTKKTTTYVEVE